MDIKKILLNFQNKDIKYIPNPGNAGDSIIARSTLQMFREIGLNFKICDPNNNFKNDVTFYGGGGNLIEKYTS